MFADTPTSLKNFATKFTTLVSSMKARLTFNFLDANKELRSNNLGPDNNKSNSRRQKKYYCRIKRFGPGDPSDVSHRLGTGVQQQGGSMARDNNGVHSVRQMAPSIEK